MDLSFLNAGLPTFWIAFAAAALGCYPIYRLLLRTKSRQIIDPYAPETHMQKQGTPTMGGLAIVFGVIVALVLVLAQASPQTLWDSTDAPAFRFSPLLLSALVLFVTFSFIGFADDFLVPRYVKGKRGLGWKQKIIPEFIFAFLGAWILNNGQLHSGFWLTVFLVLFYSNAYNFADGLDALAGSVLLAFCGGLFLIAGVAGSGSLREVGVLTAALAGATIPYMFLNAPPAKWFMGDVGSLGIGAALGVGVSAVVLGYPSNVVPNAELRLEHMLPLAILSFVLIAELVPVPMQVGYYKLTKKRLFPMTPIHHAFEKKGWKESRVVWAFALSQFVLSVAAVSVMLWL